MVIRACPELFRLAVEVLHHQRIENADRFQCFHIAMNASERCVETVEKIVYEGFGAMLESFGALVNSVSAIGRLSLEGDLWSGTVRALTRARPVFFCVTDFRERSNEKQARHEETNFVKRVL